MKKPHEFQFVTVEFSRGSSIVPNSARYPWHWAIVVQKAHEYHISPPFDTLKLAAYDFQKKGVKMVDEAEKATADMYVELGVKPFDLNIRNS